MGMFELNNLGVSVPTPVEDYFLAVDELQGQQREQVMQVGAEPVGCVLRPHRRPPDHNLPEAGVCCSRFACCPPLQCSCLCAMWAAAVYGRR